MSTSLTSPEAGPHPVIVVSREDLNRGHYALVVVCTSFSFPVRSRLPSCVPFWAGKFGFTVASGTKPPGQDEGPADRLGWASTPQVANLERRKVSTRRRNFSKRVKPAESMFETIFPGATKPSPPVSIVPK